MRRGRPTRPTSHQSSAKPSPSPMRPGSNDPFAMLDGSRAKQSNNDELSSRFPTLDQFSLLHEKSGKFEFEAGSADSKEKPDDLSQRITNALADEAFARAPKSSAQRSPAVNQKPTKQTDTSLEERNVKPSPDLRAELTRQQTTQLHQPVPQKPTMVSTGTMTSPSPPQRPQDSPVPSQRPIYRFPAPDSEQRPPHQPWDNVPEKARSFRDDLPRRSSYSRKDSKAQPSAEELPKSPASSRPSLEGPRPSALELGELNDPLIRSKSANAKSRPASAFVASKGEYFQNRDTTRPSLESSLSRQYEGGEPLHPTHSETEREYERANITSDIDFLRAKEEEEMHRKREKRASSGSKHAKRSSLTSISLSGTKTLLAGRFGEAFRRFEHNAPQERSSSPENINATLTPIAGSEVTEISDDDRAPEDADDADDISPEMRRELERRRLSQEEKRVTNAAAEYRQQVTERGGDGGKVPKGDVVRSASIQNKVHALFSESNKPLPTAKTASGYGKYTDTETALQAKQFDKPIPERPSSGVSRKPVASQGGHDFGQRPSSKEGVPPSGFVQMQIRQSQAPPTPIQTRPNQRPAAPPKPKNLRTGNQSESTASTPHEQRSFVDDQTTNPNEDWEENFSRRYPSLSGLEMVETEIDIPRVSMVRTKEV